MSIQSNINQALTVAGALASQSPEFKQKKEIRMATSNFDRLQQAIDKITEEHSAASGNEKRQLTGMKKQFIEQSNIELEKMKDIALKTGDVEAFKKYKEMKLINNPPKQSQKSQKAKKSLESAQIQQKAQESAVRGLIDDLKKANRADDIKSKKDIMKGGEM